MVKRTMLLLSFTLLFCAGASASVACYFCSATGHGGGNGCVFGPDGVSNPNGCYCYTNSKTHACQYAGCPCHCEGDPITGYICSCYCSAVGPNPNAPTAKNIKAEHDKWLAEYKAEEESGALLPNRPIIWHARSASCLRNGGAFMIGMVAAASELGHPVKFNIGDSTTDSLQDQIDEGISGLVPLAPQEPLVSLPYVEMPGK